VAAQVVSQQGVTVDPKTARVEVFRTSAPAADKPEASTSSDSKSARGKRSQSRGWVPAAGAAAEAVQEAGAAKPAPSGRWERVSLTSYYDTGSYYYFAINKPKVSCALARETLQQSLAMARNLAGGLSTGCFGRPGDRHPGGPLSPPPFLSAGHTRASFAQLMMARSPHEGKPHAGPGSSYPAAPLLWTLLLRFPHRRARELPCLPAPPAPGWLGGPH
jgi:hypothetical protein